METVLKGLREAEAPAGMERRLLSALGDGAGVESRAGWRSRRTVWPAWAPVRRSLAWGVAVAGGFALVLLLPVGHRRESTRVERTMASAGVSVPRGAAREIAKDGPGAVSVYGGRRVVSSTSRGVRGRREAEAAGVRAVRATSFPAPPLPLTEQERLLVRVVHTGDAGELAMLDPQARVQQEARQKTAFHEFFPELPVSDDQPPRTEEK